MTFRILIILSLLICLDSQAMVENQARDPIVKQWLNFMKYRKKGKVYQSPVNSSQFFLSPNGPSDAEQELRTSIRMFSEIQESSDRHLQCVYPARYALLRQKFDLAPPVICPNFDAWRRSYEITSVNVLYGSQFISNPTSAFGHSFFLIDSNTTMEYSRVTYNYGADIPEGVGARLIIDGLGGGFNGNYSVIPLYHRLHSYNDIENRDIWEYTLKLTTEERDLLIKMLWEVQGNFSAPYYFLTENCASAILDMINIVRPELYLKTSSPLFSSPQEIFRVLHKNDLISSVKYRPSLEKQLDQKLKNLSQFQKSEFQEALKPTAPFPRDSLVAEVALTYVQLLRQKNAGMTPEGLKSFERKALLMRAEMPDFLPFQFLQEDWPAAPHEAQGPNVIAIGRSTDSFNRSTIVSFRPAFHDLMQTDAGFLTDSSIDILTLDASIPDGEDLRLEKFTLGKIVNFREVKIYDPLALSWMIGGEIVRNPFSKDNPQYHLAVSPEFGFASKVFSTSLLIFGLAGVHLREGDAEPFGEYDFGPRFGAVGSFGRWKAYLSYRIGWQSPKAWTWQKREAEIKLRYNLNQEWDILGAFQQLETARGEKTYQESDLSIRYSF